MEGEKMSKETTENKGGRQKGMEQLAERSEQTKTFYPPCGRKALLSKALDSV